MAYPGAQTVTIIAGEPLTPGLTTVQQGDRTVGTAGFFANGTLINDSAKPDGDWQGKPAKFTLVRDSAEYPVTFTFANP